MRRENLLIIFVLFAAVLFSYGNSLSGGFIWDDEFLVAKNALVRAPLLSFEMFRQDIVNSNFNYTIYYRPLQILSYALDHRVWMLDPLGYHLSNVLLHFFNAVLLFFLVGMLFRNRVLAFLTAVFFAVNPVHAGAVSYISGRADLLCLFFTLLSMVCFSRFRLEGKREFWFISAIAFLAALLSKEAAVVVPFLIILADQFALKQQKKGHFSDHALSFACLAAYGAVHHHFFSGKYGYVLTNSGFAQTFLSFLKMTADFFALSIVPLGLHMRRFAGVSNGQLLICSVLLAALTVVFILMKKERKQILFAVLFFVIALLPLIFVVKYFKVFAEHWMYTASCGVFLLEAAVVLKLYEKAKSFLKIVPLGIIFAITVFYVSSSVSYSVSWGNDVALSDRVLGFTKTDPVAMHYKAVSLMKSDKTRESLDMIRDYVELNRLDPRSWYIKGRLELAANDLGQAEKDFKKALECDVNYDNGYFGLAFVALARNNTLEGIGYLEKTVKMNPKNSEALMFLGISYSENGNDEKALETLKAAKKTDPYNYDVLVNLGTLYVKAGDSRMGALEYLKAAELYPEKALPFYNLAYLFYKSGEMAMAVEYLDRTLKVEPNFRAALELLAEMKRGKGKN